MRTSYTSFVQFYLLLVLAPMLFFFELNMTELTFFFAIKIIAVLLCVWLAFNMKFIRIKNDDLIITNVFGVSSSVLKEDIKSYGRVYFQICWITFKDGKRILFMQRMYDCFEDILTNNKESKLDRLFIKKTKD
jgi:hypothetical protein